VGDPPAIWADSSRAREVLGFCPSFDLEGMLATAWRWHETHPGGYVTSPTLAAAR
jgi:UDP-glucose 4-epimerase